jgi:hypothetical protein
LEWKPIGCGFPWESLWKSIAPIAKFEVSTSSSKGLLELGCVSTGSEVRISMFLFNVLVQVVVQRKGWSFFSRQVSGLMMWENLGMKAQW